MKLLIKNGRVIDPAQKINEVLDVLIEDGRISRLARNIPKNGKELIDAAGKVVIPGLVDMHVHLREPGREDKETIATGSRAALKGGVTSVLAMANTLPAVDSVETVRLVRELVRKTAQANVLVAGAITKGRLGKELVAVSGLKREGVSALSDDGFPVDDAGLLTKALKVALRNNLPVICHCEDRALTNSGVMNLGAVSTRLGLRGIPKKSEYERVKRDIELARKAGAPVHIAHVSCRESVELIAQAKKRGVRATAETAPHYFALSEESLFGYDTNMKMNPPLRGKDDCSAIKQGLSDGTIDAIASDHAPHTENEKDIEFDRAEFGVVGLETLLAVSITELVHTGALDLVTLVTKLSLNPARILKIQKGTLEPGRDADIAIVSPDREWTVEKENLVSKSKNSAFLGKRLKGVVEYTIRKGSLVYRHEVASDQGTGQAR